MSYKLMAHSYPTYNGKPINKYSRPELIEIATELIEAMPKGKVLTHDEAQDWIEREVIT